MILRGTDNEEKKAGADSGESESIPLVITTAVEEEKQTETRDKLSGKVSSINDSQRASTVLQAKAEAEQDNSASYDIKEEFN